MSVRQIRQKARYSQVAACVLAGVSLATWRSYELSPEGVSLDSRAKCDGALERLKAIAGELAA